MAVHRMPVHEDFLRTWVQRDTYDINVYGQYGVPYDDAASDIVEFRPPQTYFLLFDSHYYLSR